MRFCGEGLLAGRPMCHVLKKGFKEWLRKAK